MCAEILVIRKSTLGDFRGLFAGEDIKKGDRITSYGGVLKLIRRGETTLSTHAVAPSARLCGDLPLIKMDATDVKVQFLLHREGILGHLINSDPNANARFKWNIYGLDRQPENVKQYQLWHMRRIGITNLENELIHGNAQHSLPLCEIIATRDINAGEEILIDYPFV